MWSRPLLMDVLHRMDEQRCMSSPRDAWQKVMLGRNQWDSSLNICKASCQCRQVWDVEEEGINGEVFEGASRSVDLG